MELISNRDPGQARRDCTLVICTGRVADSCDERGPLSWQIVAGVVKHVTFMGAVVAMLVKAHTLSALLPPRRVACQRQDLRGPRQRHVLTSASVN